MYLSTNTSYKDNMIKYKKNFYCILAFIVLFTSAQMVFAAVSGHTLSYSSVDSGVIRYGGSTKYDLDYAIKAWNALGTVNIAPDILTTIEDLTIKDKSKSSETWSGLYTHYPLIADTIVFNTYVMDNRTTNKAAMNKKTVMHELGHALGIDDHYDDTYKNIIMYGHPNTQNTITSHDKEDYKSAN